MKTLPQTLLKLLPAVAVCALLSPINAMAAPKVIASIKPLHILATAVMRDIAEPELLIHNNVSPHDFQLQPSVAGKIQRADLLIWVGPALESRLKKPVNSLTKPAQRLTLLEYDLPVRLYFDQQPHKHDAGAVDPHIWLDPDNAVAIVAIIADALVALDPANADRYRHNAGAVSDGIIAADRQLRASMSQIAGAQFLIVHDNLRYFTAHYNLQVKISLSVSDHKTPGARTLAEFKKQLRSGDIDCLLYDASTSPKLLNLLRDGADSSTVQIDPLGIALTADEAIYPSLLMRLANAVTSCAAQ